ncbi:glycosyltransferase family 2 protein [Hymenobacter cavernae]|uniref:Glycosyl transferase n=1 Tax=Hymenobacter cavernae TaxID=2044852 RepID=A0ABQ1UFP8_9BACT|nr:glycosyltransferase family 2 protein [Hymenobacter cavernae]GGF17737.1 glycosyl transferase [Hymenobacter cavernae]
MMKNEDAVSVTVLLATYNGAHYIEEQLESVINQTYSNWYLIIRDDNSSDSTPDIIAGYQRRYPEKISVVEDKLNNIGAALNFNELLQKAKHARYIMLCDQDDFWLPDKIACTLTKMLQQEQQYGRNLPLLVYTNFNYVDASLRIIESRRDFKAAKINELRLCHLLAQNPIYGCTMMLNRRLADVVGTIPTIAENHDYWIALVASALGRIAYLDRKTIFYRQHGNNLSGSFDDDSFWGRFERIAIKKSNLKDVKNKLLMAEALVNAYRVELGTKQLKVVKDFINLFKYKRFSFLLNNIKNGVRRQTLTQTILFYVSAYLLDSKSVDEN